MVIKAQEHRSQELNRNAALSRLALLIQQATQVEKVRKATKPSRSAKLKRLEGKMHRATTKSLRAKVTHD